MPLLRGPRSEKPRGQGRPLLTANHTPSSSTDEVPIEKCDPTKLSATTLLSPRSASTSTFTTGSQLMARNVARGGIGGAYGPYTYEHVGPGELSASTLSQLSKSEKGYMPTPARSKTLTDPASLPLAMLNSAASDEDDPLHRTEKRERGFTLLSCRGFLNVGTVSFVLLGIIALFTAYPIIQHFRSLRTSGPGYNIGGINATGQVADLPRMQYILDKDTPQSARTYSASDGSKWNLIFSDEFNLDGRTFYPGDDAYWEGQDMHYWATGDLEWYTPDALKTKDGNLVITMAKQFTRGQNYSSGMVSTWNKFCFTTGYIEVNVSLPGRGDVPGFWPGVWTMGNLGRAGFGATTDGTWPYSYDACDVGAYPSQMDKSGNPTSSLTDGWDGGQLSKLPGQRLSACTCPGSDHPGPNVKKGRGVPEIDVLEGQVEVSLANGEVSQSFQTAPFNAFVKFVNTTPATTIYNSSITHFNPFTGTALQQSLSGVTLTNNQNYNNNGYSTYGFEWWSDPKHRDQGYITWYIDGKPTWKLTAASLGPDPVSGVGQRLIPEEPMYLILNFGMSPSFEWQDFSRLVFPSEMYVDYIRIYQRPDVKDGYTCNPPNYPTADYIQKHLNAYMDSNITSWSGAGYSYPKNSQYDGC